jgi:hypothetical protein
VLDWRLQQQRDEANPSKIMTCDSAASAIGRENEWSRPHQIIRFAAAITIPVTNAAKQKKTRRSSNNALVIGIAPP